MNDKLFSQEEIAMYVEMCRWEEVDTPELKVNEGGVEMCIGKCEKELCKNCYSIKSETGMELLRRLGYID